MQFFPDVLSSGVSALGGVELKTGGPGQAYAKANAFLESLNQELAALGMEPVVDDNAAQGPPRGFRTIQRDLDAALDNEDVERIVGKLREHGVAESALVGIEGLVNKGAAPTIGSIMGAIRGNGRVTGELTDEELQDLTGVFQKLQLSQEDSDELMGLMQEGRSFEAMRLLKARAAALDEGAFGLTAKEARTLARGLDLSAGAMRKIAGLFAGNAAAEGVSPGDTAGADTTRPLGELLGPITEDIATRRAEAEKAAARFTDVIRDALREKKSRERNDPVADTRGNGQTGRAERRMQDDMTAKANRFGDTVTDPEKDEQQSTVGKPSLPDRAQSVRADSQTGARGDARDNARDDAREDSRRETPYREKTVPVTENPNGRSATDAEKTPSRARQEFNPVLNKMDVSPGLAMPGENQAPVTRQHAAPTYTQRQEIFSQVEQGMLRQLADGNRQMTLQLNPAELGHLTLILSVKSGEVRALIRAENPEATAALAGQMDQLRATLEEQGLKVAQLDVETQLPNDTTKDQWSGADMAQYNKEQEMREQARFMRLAKLRRESGTTLAQDMQSKGMREENAASGLHIIA